MTLPPIILFDDLKGRFGPMADLRAGFEIRTGIDTTVRRIDRWATSNGGAIAALWVEEALVAMVASRATVPVNELSTIGARVCLLNGRLLIPERDQLPTPGEAIVDDEDAVIVAHLDANHARAFLASGSLPDGVRVHRLDRSPLARRPWDILAALPRSIDFDIHADRPVHALEAAPATVVGDHLVSIHAGARLWPGVVLDAEHGPIAIHDGAVIRPSATLTGPCSIGPGAVVADQATIRGSTVIGPRCKVGGEISGTIFQGCSNKAHDGFLGDSYVGKWVNLGAGTTNSNLLNTYGDVSIRLDANHPRERSGRTFLGAIIGDHAKLAIGTRVMTGTTIGVGAMIATSTPPPSLVPRFAWLVDGGPSSVGDLSEPRRWRWDRFEETMRTVMARRGVTPDDAYVAAVRATYDADA